MLLREKLRKRSQLQPIGAPFIHATLRAGSVRFEEDFIFDHGLTLRLV
jgi:hypothetical protein